MYLINKIIDTGKTLEELFIYLRKKGIKVDREIFVQEFQKESSTINPEDEKLKELFNVVNDINRVQVKIKKIKRNFCENKNLKNASLSNLYISDIIDENAYMFVFFCNRLRKIENIKITDYNEKVLNAIIDKMKEDMKKYQPKKDHKEEFSKQLFEKQETIDSDFKKNKEDKESQTEQKRKEVSEEIELEIKRIEQNAKRFKENLRKKAVPKEESYKVKDIDDVIFELEENAKKYKDSFIK